MKKRQSQQQKQMQGNGTSAAMVVIFILLAQNAYFVNGASLAITDHQQHNTGENVEVKSKVLLPKESGPSFVSKVKGYIFPSTNEHDKTGKEHLDIASSTSSASFNSWLHNFYQKCSLPLPTGLTVKALGILFMLATSSGIASANTHGTHQHSLLQQPQFTCPTPQHVAEWEKSALGVEGHYYMEKLREADRQKASQGYDWMTYPGHQVNKQMYPKKHPRGEVPNFGGD